MLFRSTAIRLEVRESNAAANNLYRKSGYHPVACLPAYYADGSDARRLEKPLNGTRFFRRFRIEAIGIKNRIIAEQNT